MDNRTNTIAGWVLAAFGAALGLSIVGDLWLHSEKPAKAGYPLEGLSEVSDASSATPEVPIAMMLATADPAKGADVFKKCGACHTIEQGAPNGIGPNLYATIGEGVAEGKGGYAFSDALKAHGGKWDFEALNAWLANPRKFATGTKMTFAGLPKEEDRANVIAYLNKMGSNLPMPAVPAAAPAAEARKDAANADISNAATPASGAPSVDPAAKKK